MAPYVTHNEISTVTSNRSARATEQNEPPINTSTSASVTHTSVGAYPYNVFCTSNCGAQCRTSHQEARKTWGRDSNFLFYTFSEM